MIRRGVNTGGMPKAAVAVVWLRFTAITPLRMISAIAGPSLATRMRGGGGNLRGPATMPWLGR